MNAKKEENKENPAVSQKVFRAELEGRDLIVAEQQSDGKYLFQVIGCADVLRLMTQYQLLGPVHLWPLPKGDGHAELLLREVLLKIRGEWMYPINSAEICHCRAVATALVDQAIVGGAHSPEKVSRQTSASTGCGTCRPEVEKLLRFRLGGP
jgi:bacterioferritin-associated ferredoxin